MTISIMTSYLENSEIEGSDGIIKTRKGDVRYAIAKLKVYSPIEYCLSVNSSELKEDIPDKDNSLKENKGDISGNEKPGNSDSE